MPLAYLSSVRRFLRCPRLFATTSTVVFTRPGMRGRWPRSSKSLLPILGASTNGAATCLPCARWMTWPQITSRCTPHDWGHRHQSAARSKVDHMGENSYARARAPFVGKPATCHAFVADVRIRSGDADRPVLRKQVPVGTQRAYLRPRSRDPDNRSRPPIWQRRERDAYARHQPCLLYTSD